MREWNQLAAAAYAAADSMANPADRALLVRIGDIYARLGLKAPLKPSI